MAKGFYTSKLFSTMPNIYNTNGRLKAAQKRLDTLDITNQNKEDIRSFLSYVASYGVSVGRQAKYIYPLQNIAKWLGKDYMKATKDDIQLLVEYINTAKKGNPEQITKYWNFLYLNYDTLNCCENRCLTSMTVNNLIGTIYIKKPSTQVLQTFAMCLTHEYCVLINKKN